ncbi:MAG: hypothetical protein AUK35_04275 [Zetaproteobacteria bacterium CG2_30_46_52]|nr:MAG: hypothetical protein AUK35_04275 [Zetaproteobacteria bacterium CG2_30_46_52]
MPDIGLIELALIGLVGFLVLGPERLPEFFGQIGRIVRDGRAWLNGLKNQLAHEKSQLSNPINEVTSEIKASVENIVDVSKGDQRD